MKKFLHDREHTCARLGKSPREREKWVVWGWLGHERMFLRRGYDVGYDRRGGRGLFSALHLTGIQKLAEIRSLGKVILFFVQFSTWYTVKTEPRADVGGTYNGGTGRGGGTYATT